MSTLKQLITQQQFLEEQLIDSIGELTPEMENQLMELEINIPDKIDKYSGFIDFLDHKSAVLKLKATKYKNASDKYTNLSDRLRERIKYLMIENGLLELKGNDETFKLSRGKPKVIVSSTDKIPRKYIDQVVTEKPKKDELKEAIEKGEIIPGVTLEQTLVLKRKL